MLRNSSKTLIILIVAIVMIAVSAFVASAQDDDTDPLIPYRHGGMHGMMGNGFGPGMMWGNDEPMMVAVAEALELEWDVLFAAFQDGQTLAEIAEAQGIDLDTVYDAMFLESEAHMAALIEAGTITQEQADEHLAWMHENIATMPMFANSGFAPCMGGFGMMGNRRGYGMRGS